MTNDTSPETLSTDGGYGQGESITLEGAQGPRWDDVAVIAATEYRLSIKNRWAIVLTVIFAAFSLGLVTFSGSNVGPAGFERIVASLTVLAVYLVPLAALAFGYDAIVGAEDDGWLHALFALPIARWRIGIGTYIGRAIALVSAIAIGFGVAGAILLRDFGLASWDGFAVFLLASMGLALAFLAIALVLSAIAGEKTHALGGSLLVWVWFVLVHDLLALGIIAAFDLPDLALEAMVVSNPAGVFRVLVLSALGSSGDAGFASVLAATDLTSVVLVGSLLAWIFVPLVMVGIAMGRRTV